jgi:hypothetical protein
MRSDEELAILDIPVMRLTPGRYRIDLSIAQKGSRRIDHVEDAGFFDVVDADVYGSGYQVTSHFGVFFLDGRWTLKNRR